MIYLVVSNLRIFFFQAEDGIRDGHVTGVQTCALPISPKRAGRRLAEVLLLRLRQRALEQVSRYGGSRERPLGALRSEERRVGKEWRSWWGRECEKKNSVTDETLVSVARM